MSSILFVYNADSGLASALLDTGRRIFRPNVYPCALCMVTYGPFGMKNEWKNFTNNLPFTTSFIHKDELPAKYKSLGLAFPCVLLDDDTTTTILISALEFETINDLSMLQQQVKTKLQLVEARAAVPNGTK